jgi:ankyrin repeat protein
MAVMLRGLFLALLCAGCIDVRTEATATSPQEANMANHSVGGKTAQDVFSDDQLRALALASCAGRGEEVTRIIREGTDPNGEGLDGVTPLIWAQSCDSLPGMEALLQGGADPNKRFSDVNAVWLAAADYRVEQLELLLRYGADISFAADDGKTVLIAAIRRGHRGDGWDNYELLLRSGAPINQVTSAAWIGGRGMTIAEEAAHRQQFDRVVQLLELGYNVRLRKLGRLIEVQIEDDAPIPSEQVRWRARAQEMLVAMGVQFPVGPIDE